MNDGRAAGKFPQRNTLQIFSFQLDRAGVRSEIFRQKLQSCGLSAAVGSHQRGDLPALYLYAEIAKNLVISIGKA